jgi:hypothetical protein
MAIGQELLNVPMGQMIRDMAFAIADAQVELDEASMKVASMMSGQVTRVNENGEPVDGTGAVTTTNAAIDDTRVFFGFTLAGTAPSQTRVPAKVSMLELGFSPTFYQFVDTIIEVKISISISSESSYQHRQSSFSLSVPGGIGLAFGGGSIRASTVSASYANKYQYSADGSSLMRTKLVPLPPPAILEERIRQLIENPPAVTT